MGDGMSIFIGIDPGLHGAIAFYRPGRVELRVEDIPVHDLTVNGKKRSQVDKHRLRDLLYNVPPGRAFVEDVHYVPRFKPNGQAQSMGVSAFKFGFVAGCIQQAIVDAGCELVLVPPQVWKRRFNLSSDKDASRARASELLPAHANLWPLKKHDGRAEAALIALYGARYG